MGGGFHSKNRSLYHQRTLSLSSTKIPKNLKNGGNLINLTGLILSHIYPNWGNEPCK